MAAKNTVSEPTQLNGSEVAPSKMDFLARFFYRYRRVTKVIRLFLIIAGPGIIVMVADNDAGGITTYAVTGSNYGYALIWFMVLLCPVAYVVQEMCVRLGAVTKRGFAEVIFEAFGPFWGWFSLIDLTLTDFLTIVTEFIGMTAALSIFHVPPACYCDCCHYSNYGHGAARTLLDMGKNRAGLLSFEYDLRASCLPGSPLY